MKIIEAYKTSHGLFKDLCEAQKKQYRARVFGSRSGEVEYELVEKVFVLESDGHFFELIKVELQ